MDPSIPLLGFIGRLDHQKGPDLVLNAAGEMAARNVQVDDLFQIPRWKPAVGCLPLALLVYMWPATCAAVHRAHSDSTRACCRPASSTEQALHARGESHSASSVG